MSNWQEFYVTPPVQKNVNTRKVNSSELILWAMVVSFHDSPLPLIPPGGFLICMLPPFPQLFLPVGKQRKKIADKLFQTGSVSHALRVVSPVPYSQHASVSQSTTLSNTPSVWIFSQVGQ